VIPIHDAALHAAHAMPFGALKGSLEHPAGGGILRMRYDGFSENGEPRVFAVFPLRDLEALRDAIRLPEPPGVGLPGSEVFFMNTGDGPALYVDTDLCEQTWITILDTAADRGIEVLEARGDLMHLCHVPGAFKGVRGVDADVRPPRVPAWDANGFEHLPIEAGIALMGRKDVGPTHDDPGIPRP